MTYNKSEIMKRAWGIKKSTNVNMSIALKAAWALTKALIAAEENGKFYGFNYKVCANDWVKYGKNRTYVETRIYTNAWNLKRVEKLGYIDNLTGEMVAA